MRSNSNASTTGDLRPLPDFAEFLTLVLRSFCIRAMHGAEEFLALICEREERILSRLFSAAAEPFST